MVARRTAQIVFGLVAATLVALLLVSDLRSSQISLYDELEREYDTLSQINAQMARENDELVRKVAISKASGDLSSVEKTVREVLGYVREGEILVILPE